MIESQPNATKVWVNFIRRRAKREPIPSNRGQNPCFSSISRIPDWIKAAKLPVMVCLPELEDPSLHSLTRFSPDARMLLSGSCPIATFAYRKREDETFEGLMACGPSLLARVAVEVEANDDAATEVPAVRSVAEVRRERFVTTDWCRLGCWGMAGKVSFSGTVNSLRSFRSHSALTLVSREFWCLWTRWSESERAQDRIRKKSNGELAINPKG